MPEPRVYLKLPPKNTESSSKRLQSTDGPASLEAIRLYSEKKLSDTNRFSATICHRLRNRLAKSSQRVIESLLGNH